jgi:ribose/xylose/arabinose/galactoside ABC-type transport system permease subunit
VAERKIVRSAISNWALSFGVYVLLGAIFVLFSVTSHTFFSLYNLVQIAIVSCFLLTVSAGLTLVVITGEIDLSVGSIAYLSGVLLYASSNEPWYASLILGGLLGLGLGLFNGFLVSYLRMNSLLATLGLMIALRGAGLLITGGTVQPVGAGIASLGRIRVLGVIPLIFVVAVVVMCVLQLLLSRTKFGVFCYATGNNAVAASKVGIPVAFVKLSVFAISGITASVAGMLLAMYLGEVTTFSGRGMEFQATAALVIGGTSLFGGRGNIIPSSAVGVLLLLMISNGLSAWGVSPYVYPFAAGGVIFVAIYLDSLKHTRRRLQHIS